MDRSQKPSTRYPMGVAVCGTPITEGLLVLTNELRVGKVRVRRPGEEWFDVEYVTGSKVMQNPERVTTRFENVSAEEWAKRHDWLYSAAQNRCTKCGVPWALSEDHRDDVCPAPGVKTYLQVGEDFKHPMPHSEVCMHLKVAGKVMLGSLVGDEDNPMVQLWDDLGGEFSFPITPGEAGLYHDTNGYYYYRKGWAA